ncbi:hypothetical protein [Tardiphaga robiniae]|uniref:hypothetical protein n=1 Tax=Tardiphaga robiniae TaxID=943830 RepID=UPI0015865A44|nr:hypothetical protein [Tardiphaga robiniae]NUU44546.1 hypothetical protein [Tardiphaga robiniae]
MSDANAMVKSLEILDRSAKELSGLGFNNVTVSEMFFAYGIRIGVLVEGAAVFGAARAVIDSMEKQSRG